MTNKVRRYMQCDTHLVGGGYMKETEGGMWINHQDYTALQTVLDKTADMLREVRDLAEVYDSYPSEELLEQVEIALSDIEEALQ